jgi:aminoglycoside phosphotransferase family enzyme
MRRLDRNSMLPEMLAHGEATGAHADAVGERLAHFYCTARRTAWDPAEYRRRLCTQVTSTGEELLDRGASRTQVDPIVRDALVRIEQEARTLEARIACGYVVDAHGDLRPEHVCLETPPVIIDPLEFDEDLRTLDAASELAFFALECERLGASWFAERVLARYAAVSGDPMPLPLRRLYRAQHALTRALIALRHVDDADARDRPRWRAKADDYLARIA